MYEKAFSDEITEGIRAWYTKRGFTAVTRVVLAKDQTEMVSAVVYEYGASRILLD